MFSPDREGENKRQVGRCAPGSGSIKQWGVGIATLCGSNLSEVG